MGGRVLHAQCLCGAVRFHGTPVDESGIKACHCGQCRRWGGGGPVMPAHFEWGVGFDDDTALTWYRSSDYGERGFCRICGSSLFWREPESGKDVAINASTLPEDHGSKLAEHIWIEDKPGWYEFADDCPRRTSTDILGNA